jgi:hypothetical protein
MAVHRVVSCVEQSQQLFKRLRVALCKNTRIRPSLWKIIPVVNNIIATAYCLLAVPGPLLCRYPGLLA